MNSRLRISTVFTILAFVVASTFVGSLAATSADAAPKDDSATRVAGVYYQIKARHSDKCLDVRAASPANVTPVIQYQCIIRHANQEWQLDRNAAGFYQIRVRHSGKCLDVEAGSTADRARLIQYTCHGGPNQQFRLSQNVAGFYEIRARHSGKCVDVEAGSTNDGTQVIQWTCHGGPNQQFVFEGSSL